MFEHFTHLARRAMMSAQMEAERHGTAYVSTEHELLGIADDDECVGAQLLDRIGAEHACVRSETEAALCRISRDTAGPPTLTTLGYHVVQYAREEARLMDEEYVGTGHLLLGLIREKDGLASRLLAKQGVDLARARVELRVLRRDGMSEAPSDSAGLPEGVGYTGTPGAQIRRIMH